MKRDNPTDCVSLLIDEARACALTGAAKLKVLKTFSSGFSGTDLVPVVGLVGEWMVQAIGSDDVGVMHACLGCLEQLPVTLDTLKATSIGKVMAEQFKMCKNEVAVARARRIITNWKASVESPADRAERVKRMKKSASSPVEPVMTIEEESPMPMEDDPAVSALASLLDNMPELEALNNQPVVTTGRRKISWRPQLVQLVEFAITDTCEELRQSILHNGIGAGSLHHTYAEQSRFAEQSRKERAMGGKGLGSSIEEEDLEPSIEYRCPRIVVPSGAISVKDLKSYERQDLADLHGGRRETLYTDSVPPDTPAEPSTSSKFHSSISLGGVTVEVFPSGINNIIIQNIGELSFEEEFVKLDSELQTAIMASEDLVKLFSQDPGLLRQVTVSKIQDILRNLNTQRITDDQLPRKRVQNVRVGGVSTIVPTQYEQPQFGSHAWQHAADRHAAMHADQLYGHFQQPGQHRPNPRYPPRDYTSR